MNILKRILKVLGLLAGTIVLIAVLLIVGSRWHITPNSPVGQDVLPYGQTSIGFLKHSGVIPDDWLPGYPVIVVKEKLGAGDALVNAFAAFCFWATIIPFALVASIAAIVLGLYYAHWWAVLAGILAPILLVIALPIAAVIYWLAMFFQPITPAFGLIWFFLGVPGNLFGFCRGALLGVRLPYTIVVISAGGNVKVFKGEWG